MSLRGVLQILDRVDDTGCGINSMEHGVTNTIFIWKSMETPWVAKKDDLHLIGFANHANVNLPEDRLPWLIQLEHPAKCQAKNFVS